ncbi:MAG TPA: hypothetical protein VJN29_15910 [Intrasporangium sp.]|uniref:hypothetical protein n=1 Tax=Intrasporangium sp. TaxID=1925024 RepID=UPI002B49AEA9|nr:hypothetical protein [Intrasporangium sp.]HKX68702.1 hypothetical protein [Intrasporangium sp.]
MPGVPHTALLRGCAAKLAQVEAPEAGLRALGFPGCTVRHRGEVARVELPDLELGRAMEPEVRAATHAVGVEAGSRFVAVDVAGIQSGAFTLPLVRLGHG